MTHEPDLPEEPPLVLLTVTNDPTAAQMIAEMLHNNAIDCLLQGDVQAILPAGALDDMQLYVQPGDLAQAQALLQAYFTGDERPEAGDA